MIVRPLHCEDGWSACEVAWTDCCETWHPSCETVVQLDGNGEPDVRTCRRGHGCTALTLTEADLYDWMAR